MATFTVDVVHYGKLYQLDIIAVNADQAANLAIDHMTHITAAALPGSAPTRAVASTVKPTTIQGIRLKT